MVGLLRNLEPLAHMGGIALACEVRRLRARGALSPLLRANLGPEVQVELQKYREELIAMQEALRAVASQERRIEGELRDHCFPISAEVKAAADAEALAAYPYEAMGLILRAGAEYCFVRLDNTLIGGGGPSPRNNSVADPEQLDHLGWAARAFGLNTAAFFHSHPDSWPLFSRDDLQMLRTRLLDSPGIRAYIVGCDGARCTEAAFAVDVYGACKGEDHVKELR